MADPNDRRRVMIYPGPQDTDVVAGLYDAYMGSLTRLLEGYSDAELILITDFTDFIDSMIKINHEQAR